MSWTQNVFSTMVSEIGYDTDSNELLVTWKNGKRSAYAGVPEEKAVEIANAPSVGQAINQEIKNQYSHRYI